MTDYPPGSGPPPRIFTEPEGLRIIGENTGGVLATVKRDGRPHLSNMMYTWDPDNRALFMSTTATRVKVRHLRANPKAALHVPGPDFFSYAVAEGEAELSDVSTTPGDGPGRLLLPLYRDVNDDNREAFFKQMVLDQRLLITLRVSKVYGMAIEFD
jgi:PPOX class probable F420-dependent enzyme